MQFIFYGIGVFQLLILLFEYFVKIRFGKQYLFLSILLLTLLSGLRYEVGMDWEGYENFFKSVNGFNIENPPIMEIGFGFLNKIIGYFADDYSYVIFFSALVFGWVLWLLYQRLSSRLYVYAISSYIGYSFLVIGFAQVRQGIAIGFILLSIYFYNFKKFPAYLCMLVASVSVFFQLSSVIYLALMLIANATFKYKKSGLYLLLFGLFVQITLFVEPSLKFDALNLFKLNVEIASKIENYMGSVVEESIALYVNCAILAVNSAIIWRCIQLQYEKRANFLSQFYLVLNLSCVLSVLILPGFYVFYSRLYLLSSIILPVVFYLNQSLLEPRKFYFTLFINSFVLMLNYFKSLVAWGELFLNYKTFIWV